MNFMNVFSKHYKLCNKLCEMEWDFQVIYNGDDRCDPRIEFVYRNEIAVVRTTKDADEWLKVLNEESDTNVKRVRARAEKRLNKLKEKYDE